MRYGSVVNLSESNPSLGTTGLTERTVHFDGRAQQLWVGLYPNPKQLHFMKDNSTCKSGFFVIDENSYRWIEHFIAVRQLCV